MEAEYIALSEATKEVIWLKRILDCCSLFGIKINVPVIFCDNKASIEFSKSEVENTRTKHVDVKYHYVRVCTKRINSNSICNFKRKYRRYVNQAIYC
ncbi:hypothetical protein CHUAL_014137 [Chamberlinius hualienensis]